MKYFSLIFSSKFLKFQNVYIWSPTKILCGGPIDHFASKLYRLDQRSTDRHGRVRSELVLDF